MSETHAGNLKLVGGHPAVDFVNTVDWRRRAERREWLVDCPALLAWARHAGLIGVAEARRLTRLAKADPVAAEAARVVILVFREALCRVFESASAGGKPKIADLETINETLLRAPPRRVLVPTAGGLGWEAQGGEKGLDSLLPPLAWSAADLLASDRLARVHECEDEACGWFFLDTSRTRSRRWCSMESCGNRAKARRHYQRVRRKG